MKIQRKLVQARAQLGKKKMMVLMHFDWNGTEESLQKFIESGKKIAVKIEGAARARRMLRVVKQMNSVRSL